MKILILLITFILNMAYADFKFDQFSKIQILHEGRVKPIDTVARLKLKNYYGKDVFNNTIAIEWFAELLFNPKSAYSKEIFKIKNPDIINILNLNSSKKYVSFIELYQTFDKKKDFIDNILKTPENELDLTNKEIKDLYNNFLDYLNLSRSFSFLHQEFNGSSVFDLTGKKLDQSALKYIELFKEDSNLPTLKFINNDGIWFSPWELFLKDKNKLNTWDQLYLSYYNKDIMPKISTNNKIEAEIIFNKFKLDNYSLAFYLISFLIIIAYFFSDKNALRKIANSSLILGTIIHIIFISFRSYILNRAPVSNLYESIVFVSLISSIIGLLYENKKQNGHGTFIGSTLGSILLLLSFGHINSNDSMSMVVAVLDTNFWLITHVITISIGYGATLVASMLAHIILIKKEFKLIKNLHGLLIFSLLFVIVGTMLGGIWADQSWGRFWGWDPKENGALLVSLWLLFIVHGKISGIFNQILFAIASAFSSVIVILAWFGVNLLNVGLHSYGFSSGTAYSILALSAVEIVLLTALYFRNKLLM